MASKRRRAVLARARSSLTGYPPYKFCKYVGKQGFFSRTDVSVAMSLASRDLGYARTYRCPYCELFHITTKPLRTPKARS